MVNTFGPFYLMKLILPGMVTRRDGVVVNIVSGAAERPRPNRAMYGSQKAATEHMTLAVAQEVAGYGIRVYAFHPGPVDTALFASSRTAEEMDRARAGSDSADDPGLQDPAEPAAALAWLASRRRCGLVRCGDAMARSRGPRCAPSKTDFPTALAEPV